MFLLDFLNEKSVMVLGSFICLKLIEIGNLIYLFYHFGKTRLFGVKC